VVEGFDYGLDVQEEYGGYAGVACGWIVEDLSEVVCDCGAMAWRVDKSLYTYGIN